MINNRTLIQTATQSGEPSLENEVIKEALQKKW